ncbi:broad-complex core protein isoforms 1/2/3/4/5-like [Artemia franciscana]|uniref:broad-complex core protein isoforms 1/2/3/4/5-like n=1 Tax=Artemia franciscana TaxID=6661 RepID=UPI0032DA19B4
MTNEYSLKWNRHQSTVVACLSSLRQSCSFVDVTLHTSDGHTFSGHKVILSACSSFFENVLRMHPNEKVVVFLKDVSHIDLKIIMEFMYSGEVSILKSNLPSLLNAAEALGIKGLCRSSDENDTTETNEGESLPKKKKMKSDNIPEPVTEEGFLTRQMSSEIRFPEQDESTLPNIKPEPIEERAENEILVQSDAQQLQSESDESGHGEPCDVPVEVYENEGAALSFEPKFESSSIGAVPLGPAPQILSALLRRPKGNESREELELDPEEVAIPMPGGEVKCRECDRNFESMYKFRRHVKSTHGGRNFQCKFCDRKFKLRHHVRDHMIRSHSVIE